MAKQLRKKQLAVIDDLFAGELDERAVLDKHKVSRHVYNKWRADEQFAAEFDRRITSLNQQSRLFVARYTSLAAAKLVQLTDSKSQETARKACLDIISFPKTAAKKTPAPADDKPPPPPQTENIPDETASRLLAALAQTENNQPNNH